MQQGLPYLSVADLVLTERNSNKTNAVFTVTLSRSSEKTVTVHYFTSDGTASAASDYYAAGGNVSFAPGVTSATASVTVLGDRVVEPNETFFLNLDSPVNAQVSRSPAQATILNDDGVAGQVDHFQLSAVGSPNTSMYPSRQPSPPSTPSKTRSPGLWGRCRSPA